MRIAYPWIRNGRERVYIYMTKRWWCTVKWILILGSADQTPGDYRFTLVFLALLYLKEIRKNREDETVISKPGIHDSKARASEVAPSSKKECESQRIFSNDWLWRSNSAFLEDSLFITLFNFSKILNYNCRIITKILLMSEFPALNTTKTGPNLGIKRSLHTKKLSGEQVWYFSCFCWLLIHRGMYHFVRGLFFFEPSHFCTWKWIYIWFDICWKN